MKKKNKLGGECGSDTATGTPREEKVLHTSAVEDFPDPGLVTYSVDISESEEGLLGKLYKISKEMGDETENHMGAGKEDEPGGSMFPGKRAEQEER